MFLFGGRGVYFPTIFQQTSPIALFSPIFHFHTSYFSIKWRSFGLYDLHSIPIARFKSASPRVSTSGSVPSPVGQSLIPTPNCGFRLVCYKRKITSFELFHSWLQWSTCTSVEYWINGQGRMWCLGLGLEAPIKAYLGNSSVGQLSPRPTRTVLYATKL